MKYPAIVYGLSDMKNDFANDEVYTQKRAYQITVIDEDPDSLIAEKISFLQTCRFASSFQTDNLNHFVFKLYY